jgi:2-keto-4-pentenoate hydratase/2-oxohepta-3-ene-1,7-dioic acid hydratase in catechol pathway
MKFCSFVVSGQEHWGLIDNDEVRVIELWPTLGQAIASHGLAEAVAHARTAPTLNLAQLSFLPVIPEPAKIICVGLNYEAHRKETGRSVSTYPTLFTRFSDTQVGHRQDLVLPPESTQLDYEGELAVIIGSGGRRIRAADALDHVAGYACYNDASVRDWQYQTTQFTAGKNWPRTGAFGPWMVTPEEFGAIGPQRLQTRLNGQVMQEALLADMIFPIPHLIEYISTFTRLAAGDVIVSGTPGGVGHKRNPQVFMRSGDQVEVEIDGVGILSNPVANAFG